MSLATQGSTRGERDGALPSQGRRVLVLRPNPGDAATIARAEGMGFVAIAAPLFGIVPVAWTPSDAPHDALMLTSANALRHAGDALAR